MTTSSNDAPSGSVFEPRKDPIICFKYNCLLPPGSKLDQNRTFRPFLNSLIVLWTVSESCASIALYTNTNTKKEIDPLDFETSSGQGTKALEC